MVEYAPCKHILVIYCKTLQVVCVETHVNILFINIILNTNICKDSRQDILTPGVLAVLVRQSVNSGQQVSSWLTPIIRHGPV